MCVIQWVSEEILKKEKVLAESNGNDYFHYQKDREELDEEKKKNSDWSWQVKWREESTPKMQVLVGFFFFW